MACNLPIVATDVGDVRQVIGGTRGCFVCAPTVAEFAEKLAEILRRRERTQGRQAVRHFDRALVTRRVVQVYEETLRKHAARRPGGARKAT
jgi:glycosyltransferase involved in cell wall biosynthesis